jgi:cytochrome c556
MSGSAPQKPGRLLVAAVAMIAACGVSIPAHGEDALADAKHRQTVMDRMGDDVKAIKLYLLGAADAAGAAKAAGDIEATAKILPSLFPKGTDSTSLPGKSAAKPDIWNNPEDFSQLVDALASDSAALRKALQAADPAAQMAAFKTMAKEACGACHQTYRGKRDGG